MTDIDQPCLPRTALFVKPLSEVGPIVGCAFLGTIEMVESDLAMGLRSSATSLTFSLSGGTFLANMKLMILLQHLVIHALGMLW